MQHCNVDMHKQISAPPAPPQIQLSLLSNLSQGIVLCWEQSLQKSSESKSSVMVVGKCEWTTYMPYGGGKNNVEYRCFEIIAQRFQQKHVNYNLVFFSRRDRDFYNLIVRDEIEICTFYISCFETRSRFAPSISHASRRDREFALSNLEFREGDEK